MQRNIITTISLSKGKVSITALEKLSTNVVELFNDESTTDKINIFLEKSISHIEKLISGNITKVSFIIEPSETVDAKIELTKETINIVGSSVSKVDIDNALKLAESKFTKHTSKTIIQIQPIKFEVYDLMKKSYSSAPIHKKGDKMSVLSAITTISTSVYDYINQIAQAINVEVSQILLANQAVAFANVSKKALSSGVINIHIGDNQTNVSIIKSNTIVSTLYLYNYGYKFFIKGLMLKFKCTKEEALKIMSAHASISPEVNSTVFTNQIDFKDFSFKANDLKSLIEYYIGKLIVVAMKYVSDKNVSHLPIIFSGNLSEIDGVESYVAEKTKKDNIRVYKPLEYIQLNVQNTFALGTINYIDMTNELLGKNIDTIVHTNPNTLNIVKKEKQKGLFTWIKKRIGGKYEWNYK